jgi:PDZ domain-containing secreted protein
MGFNLGDDVCLYDEDDNSVSESQMNADLPEDGEINNNVERLADKLVHDLVETDDIHSHAMNMNEKAPAKTTESIEMFDNIHQNGITVSHVGANQTTVAPALTVDIVNMDGSAMGNSKAVQIVSELKEDASFVRGKVSSEVVRSARKRRK